MIKKQLVESNPEREGKGSILDPSFAELRRCITENIVIPLGSGINIENKNRTFMFYGGKGTGKSLMTKIIVSETNSVFLDISPYNLVSVFTDKISI